MAAHVPPAIKSIGTYLARAEEVSKVEPLVAYYCRTFAVEKGLGLRTSVPKEDANAVNTFLMQLMDDLEKEKATLPQGQVEEGAAYMEGFAWKIFKSADDADRAGNGDKRTAKKFQAASVFLDVCRQFGTFSDEMARCSKYAKWKAVDIAKCLKQGIRPVPGPPGGDDGEFGDMEGGGSVVPNEAPTWPPPMVPSGGDEDGDDVPPPLPSSTVDSVNSVDVKKTHTPLHHPTSPTTTATPSDTEIQQCIKYSKFAVSALNYNDWKTAITNLESALQILNRYRP